MELELESLGDGEFLAKSIVVVDRDGPFLELF
jgi:hypothetical protein